MSGSKKNSVSFRRRTNIVANSIHSEESEDDEEAHAFASVCSTVKPLASLANIFAPRFSKALARTKSHSLAALWRHVSDRMLIRVLRIESIPDGSFNTRDRMTEVFVLGLSSSFSASRSKPTKSELVSVIALLVIASLATAKGVWSCWSVSVPSQNARSWRSSSRAGNVIQQLTIIFFLFFTS